MTNLLYCKTDIELDSKTLAALAKYREAQRKRGIIPLSPEELDLQRNTPCDHCGIRAFECLCGGGL
jgi:hypothetical protein